jgi:repressor LexA
MNKTTPKQQRILDYVYTCVRTQGYPPTYEEIKHAIGLSTKSLVSHHLKSLEAKGYLRLKPNTPRGIQLANLPHLSTFRVPIAGQIAAGQPISFGDWQREFIELTGDIVREQEGLYALRVKGNSMMDALVHDGDLVIMKHQQYADDGDMVAVRLVDENETTLKRFYREKNRVRLQPANPTMKAMYCHPANVQVQGKVVAVVRQVV